MAEIAEAFVAVRPDLTGFAAALRKQVQTEIEKVRTPEIKVKPVLDRAALRALTAEIRQATARVPVTPLLTEQAKAGLRRELREVSADVRVRPVVTGAAAREAAGDITRQTERAAATGRRGVQAATASAERLAAATRQVQAAQTAAVTTTNSLTQAEERLVIAQEAEAVTSRRITQERERGNLSRAREFQALNRETQQTVAVAEARVAAITAARQQVDIRPVGLGDVEAARVQEEAARAALATVQAVDTQAAAIRTRNTELQGAIATIRQANAETLAAREGDLARATSIREEAEAVAQARGERAASAAAEAELLALEEQRAPLLAQLAVLETESAAATQASVAATLSEAEAKKLIVGIDQTLLANRQLERQLTTEELADEAARAAAAEVELVQARALLTAREQLIAAEAAQAAIQPGALELEQARAFERAAIAAARYAERVAQAALTNTVVSASAREAAVALEGEAAALRDEAAAAVVAARANLALARSTGQATRGAIATTAAFGGLRGAVLAASLPFILATVAVTAGARAVSAAATLEEDINVLQALGDIDDAGVRRLSEAARELGRDLELPGIAAQDAVSGIGELVRAGVDLEASQDAIRGVLQLSIAAEIEAGEAAEIVASQLNAYSLAGVQATEVTNTLAGVAKSAQGDITDFVPAFQQANAVAAAAGFTFEETATALATLARAGLQGSDAGTSFRTFLQRLVPQSAQAARALEELGVELDNSRNIADQFPEVLEQFRAGIARFESEPLRLQRIFQDIFGQDAVRAANILLGQSADEFASLTADITATGNAQEIADARAKGLSGAADALGSSIETLAADIGSAFNPALEEMIRGFADATEGISDLASAFGPLGETIGATVGLYFRARQILTREAFGIGSVLLGPQGQIFALATQTARLFQTPESPQVPGGDTRRFGFGRRPRPTVIEDFQSELSAEATFQFEQLQEQLTGDREGLREAANAYLEELAREAADFERIAQDSTQSESVRKDAIEELARIEEAREAPLEVLDQLAETSTFAAELAQILAARTETLQDDVRAARTIAQAASAEVAALRQRGAAAEEIEAAALEEAQAWNDFYATQRQLSEQEERAAEEARELAQQQLEARILLLEEQADAAGNLGQAQQRLIAALTEQAVGIDAVEEPLAAAQAQRAVRDAIRAGVEATQQLAEARRATRQVALEARIAIAEATGDAEAGREAAQNQIANLREQARDAIAIRNAAADNPLLFEQARQEVIQAFEALALFRIEVRNRVRDDALEAQELSTELARARIDRAIAEAELTAGEEDDRRAQQALVAQIDSEILFLRRYQRGLEQGSNEWLQTQIDIENLQTERANALQQLQEDQDRGPSFEDFVQGVIRDFQTFGPGVTGLLSGQDVRGAFAGANLQSLLSPTLTLPSAVRAARTAIGAAAPITPSAAVTAPAVATAIRNASNAQARRDRERLAQLKEQTRLLRAIGRRVGATGIENARESQRAGGTG